MRVLRSFPAPWWSSKPEPPPRPREFKRARNETDTAPGLIYGCEGVPPGAKENPGRVRICCYFLDPQNASGGASQLDCEALYCGAIAVIKIIFFPSNRASTHKLLLPRFEVQFQRTTEEIEIMRGLVGSYENCSKAGREFFREQILGILSQQAARKKHLELRAMRSLCECLRRQVELGSNPEGYITGILKIRLGSSRTEEDCNREVVSWWVDIAEACIRSDKMQKLMRGR